MKQLILAGGGGKEDSVKIDELFKQLAPKILYIPIAWKTKEFHKCKDWFETIFDNFEMWTDLQDKTYEDLEPFDGIYIGGGNTYRLLRNIKKTSFYDLILKFLDSDKVIYGGSAGAIIFGKTMETAQFGGDPDRNLVKIKDLSGFDVVNGYAIQCHYRSEQDNELKEFSKEYKTIAIPERSGIYVDEDKLKVVGFESACIFKDGEKTVFEVGSEI